jgi:NhaA family Na+:H+ antiporter
LFFFVVGLEIKRELVAGELQDRRAALFPMVAAIGGMLAPAAIYLAINAGGPGHAGWGIPMATDIAFALGVVALLGRRVPQSMKVFLLTLAIVDDIGAIVVIAVFYNGGLKFGWLAGAIALVACIALLKRVRMRWLAVYAVLGITLWIATFESGVHATIAGVVLGLLVPARGDAPLAERLEHWLDPWASFVIVPIFALANAGIPLSRHVLAGGWSIAVGVVAGLVVGKVVGITGAAWLTVRLGIGSMPPGATWRHVFGIAGVAGIGFTVSLFVTDLAFSDVPRQHQAKVGVLTASVLAALIGSTLLILAARRTARAEPGTGLTATDQQVTP